MSSECPTVRVVSPESPGGYKIINESDLTPEHEIWKDDYKPIMSLQEIMRDEVGRDAQVESVHEPARRGRPPKNREGY